MNAGRRRHKVTVQVKTISKSPVGEAVDSWSDVVDRMAQIIPLSGKELISAGQEQAEQTLRVILLFDSALSDLKPYTHRIKHGTAIYNIQHVNNIKMVGRVLECTCREDIQ